MKINKTTPKIYITVRTKVLQTVFDECDRYDNIENGGRILGTFKHNDDGTLQIQVNGVIDAGPDARRSNASFFSDGNYQADVFRRIERSNPDVEHLGNWHTHHVNGYPTLSSGDIATYRRIVNHKKHNLDFFYALLVVQRNPDSHASDRYRVRHFVLFRGDDDVYEIDSKQVSFSTEGAIWPIPYESESGSSQHDLTIRAKDKEIIQCLYPSVQPYQSAHMKKFYWRGPIKLVDNTIIQITVLELTDDHSNSKPQYAVFVKDTPIACPEITEQLDTRFYSAAEAVYSVEKKMNQLLYRTACSVEV